MALIEVDHLTKNYGHGRGIFSVSFQIEQGEVFGFVGPNGAGKTTKIRHLMGFSNPQSGKAIINGMPCFQRASTILQDIGYLPGEVALPDGLTGWQFIRMIQGLRNYHDDKRLQYLLDKFRFDPADKTKNMSLGNKRKLAIVTAFLADPKILILDEPTSGLDPVMQETFIDFLRDEKSRGKIILLSSHIFSEVDATCDRIAIIREGKIVSTVATKDIRHNSRKTYQIVFNTVEALSFFSKENGININSEDKKLKTLEVSIEDNNINLMINALAKYKVVSFKEKKFTLENYFMHFYEKKTIEEASK
ncbi:ABC transporter ATP-binding protein [Oenococcus oeni]|uniref:ATP-binding cassette domain-containing protein n=2 Tax=Oenococcus oeni TaxID=1247 RepID=A0AAJ2P2C2_OENOE|nr:ABC transporter ATP-binding protein [Oenococcus oeni]MDV7715442.1 ATP-binding cassette domain-containing protein [Oenococcus oeni]